MAELLERLQYHYHHDGGAVRVGDDVARTVESVLGVALGHHQRHVVTHAERAGIVNHHGAVLCDGLGELL